MNWRVATIINSAIALITLAAVGFDVHHRSKNKRTTNEDVASADTKARRGSSGRARERSTRDLTDLRIDKFDSVPPSEFYELFLGASAEEMTTLAKKFNDLPVNTRSAGCVGMFFQAWAELDGKSALLGAFQIKDIALRAQALDAVTHSVSPAAAGDLAPILQDYRGGELTEAKRNDCLQAIIERWSGSDPSGAARFVDALDDANQSLISSAGRTIALSWGTLDARAGLAWIDKPRYAEQSEEFFFQLINGWGRTDMNAAAAYLAQHLDRPGAVKISRVMSVFMFQHDEARALSWLRTLANGEAKTAAQQSLATAWSRTDPLSAAHWAESLPLEDQKTAVTEVATRWADQDWDQTVSWISTLTGESRDLAISGATSNYSAAEPNKMLELAMRMTSKEQCLEAVEGIVTQWAWKNREVAAAWVGNSHLSKNEKERLLSLEAFQTENATEESAQD
jgi:hypothetical protein